MPRARLLGAVTACAVALVTVWAPSADAARGPKLLPASVSAPYQDVTQGSDFVDLAKESGSRYISLAFLGTAGGGSCTLQWPGGIGAVGPGAFAQAIAALQAKGGNVIPSFGGYNNDIPDATGNLDELADSCTDVSAIAAAYEQVLTAYDVTRLDMDVEMNALDDTAGIDRRNQAIAEVEQWARSQGRPVQFSYTLPSSPHGLSAAGMAVLTSAATAGAVIHDVNLMTFDYYDGVKHNMAKDAETAATALIAQLKQTLYPHLGTAALYRHVGIIQMNGVDDYGTTEVLTLAQAKTFEKWAATKHLAYIGFWSLGRDNGGCAGTKGAWNCSGLRQKPYAFAKTFARFTRG